MDLDGLGLRHRSLPGAHRMAGALRPSPSRVSYVKTGNSPPVPAPPPAGPARLAAAPGAECGVRLNRRIREGTSAQMTARDVAVGEGPLRGPRGGWAGVKPY